MVAATSSSPPLWEPFRPGPLRLPQALTHTLRLSPEQFAQLCRANPDAVLELAADGSLISMTPTGSETGGRNAALLVELGLALRNGRLAYKLFDSSTGFRLGDGSVRSPDASLVALERWRALTEQERQGFAPLCPDLVVELASTSNDGPRGLATLRKKMATYQTNGARLGWLLIPEQRAVEVWGPLAAEPLRIEAAISLDGAPQFPGLTIDLAELWAA
ncbi:MAG: Uma2 family endonuclease [Synechococcaceae cyanobacterium]|nr:Uma2 family endonuclease [Synechococcaceae cyanobacterium]